VVDEYGGVDGIATLDDVIGELIGITPAPTLPSVDRPLAPGARPAAFTVPGDTPIHEVAARLGIDGWGENPDVVTIGGLIVSNLQRVPTIGEEVTVDGVTIQVEESDLRSIKQVRVEVSRPSEATPGHEA
jgi:putative hemolysin